MYFTIIWVKKIVRYTEDFLAVKCRGTLYIEVPLNFLFIAQKNSHNYPSPYNLFPVDTNTNTAHTYYKYKPSELA